MKRGFRFISIMMVLVLSMVLCVGCAGKDDSAVNSEEDRAVYTITIMNGETELGTLSVNEGEVLDQEKVAEFENLEGYTFNGWYGTPGFLASTAFDLTTATFTEDKILFGNFISTEFTEDTRSFYIVGESSKGGFLKGSGWAGDLTDEEKALYQLARVEEGKNDFTITLDMYAGDQFQIINDWQWDGQHGFGYVVEPDETFIDISAGAGLSDSKQKMNVAILIDGNYTVTLHTDTENSDRDTITIVRNSDATVALEEVTDEPAEIIQLTGDNVNIRVKGSWVSDWSDVKTLENVEGTSDWAITMDLEADTELCFAGYDGDTDLGIIMKEANVTDADSLALLSETGNNIKVAAAGNYTFTVNAETQGVVIVKN